MTVREIVPVVPHKPQGDSKSAVLSLNGGLLPKMATPWRHTVKVNANLKKENTHTDTHMPSIMHQLLKI